MRNIYILGAVLAVATVTSAEEAAWYPSVHGEGDTLGAVNHLSPEMVVEAARLVKTGKTYALGIVTGWESPAYPPRHYAITVIQPGQDLGPTTGSKNTQRILKIRMWTPNFQYIVRRCSLGRTISNN